MSYIDLPTPSPLLKAVKMNRVRVYDKSNHLLAGLEYLRHKNQIRAEIK